MRQLWLVVALAGTGCNQLLGIDELTKIDASGPEIDAPVFDSPAGTICAMLLPSPVCFTLPTGAITLSDINTESDARCTTMAGPSICAILADTITVPGGDTKVTGTRPLMLVATTTIRISGTLDASSAATGDAVGRHGAGSDPVPAGCGALAAGQATNDGGGGGAGGTFGTKGGDGGKGGGGNGGLGAIGDPAQPPSLFRAGCRGSAGGNNGSGPGGFGGGALYLLAGVSIEIDDRVDANGAGGTGANNGEGGGGGGGSGGMIVLESPSITMNGSSAQITANGGGGGEGTVGTDAQEGEESNDWDEAAVGGTGLSLNGGAGGPGSVANGVGEVGIAGSSGGNNNDGGGGGGGGGGGVVWIRGLAPTGPQAGRISPPPTMK